VRAHPRCAVCGPSPPRLERCRPESPGGLCNPDVLVASRDTTPIVLYGAYEDAPRQPGAPRPACGQSKDGRDDLKQVLLSLGGRGAGGSPRRLEGRDGPRSDRVETPLAMEEGLALGLDGGRGIVADSQTYDQRPLGVGREKRVWLITLGPRTWAVRQARAAWGPQQAQTSASAPGTAAAAVADHVQRVPAPWYAGWPDADAARAPGAMTTGRSSRLPDVWWAAPSLADR
jgi:hypothetical protein